VNRLDIGPWGASFDAGLKVKLVLDALVHSHKNGKWVEVEKV
jgi:hypothetical protein